MTSVAEAAGKDAMEQQRSVEQATKAAKTRIFGVAQKKDAIAVSQGNVRKYEEFRGNVYKNVFGGSLRVFWGNVVGHMDSTAAEMNSYLIFFKTVITQERNAIKAMKQTISTMNKNVSKDPKVAMECIQTEFITFHTSAMDQRKKFVDLMEADILNKGLKALTAAQKKSTDAAKSKAAALEKKVDASHQEAAKQFKAYNKVCEVIVTTPVGDPSTVADLWMQEVKYCEAATKFVSQCAEYRKAMSEMYMSYQKSETERLGNLRLLLQKYARSYKGSFAAIANSQELSVLTAALDALDGEKETVMQLKRAQEAKKDDKSGGKGRSNSVGSASKVTEDIAMNVPKPFSSKLIVCQSVMSVKAGLFQNWKKMHGIATCDDHLYVFESLAGEGGVDKVASTAPTLTFAIDRSTVQNIDKDKKTLEIVEKTKGFLGIVSVQKQMFKLENEDDLEKWSRIFPKNAD